MAGSLLRSFVAQVRRADDPAVVWALVTLWVLFVGGTLGFFLLDRSSPGVSLDYWSAAWVVVVLVAATVTVYQRQY